MSSSLTAAGMAETSPKRPALKGATLVVRRKSARLERSRTAGDEAYEEERAREKRAA